MAWCCSERSTGRLLSHAHSFGICSSDSTSFLNPLSSCSLVDYSSLNSTLFHWSNLERPQELRYVSWQRNLCSERQKSRWRSLQCHRKAARSIARTAGREATSGFTEPALPQRATCSRRHSRVLPLKSASQRKVGASAAIQAGWKNVFLPQQYVYSTDLKDVDPHQLSDLWERTLGEKRSPTRCSLAMKKSYAFVLVVVKEQHTDASTWRPSAVNPGTRIVGVARAISDGEFMATVCDVAVDPDYTGRGIGRKIVQTLVRNMKLQGPTGFAAFPPPKARRFFFMMGFRIDKKYRLMSYEGRGDFPDLRDAQAKLNGARRENQGLVTGSQPGFEAEASVASDAVLKEGR